MKIIISNIPEEGLNLHMQRDGQWFEALLLQKEKGEFSLQIVNILCSVKKVRETLFIHGSLQTSVTSICSRCLEQTLLPIETSFRYSLIPLKGISPEEKELTEDDIESGYYSEDIIDLDPLFFEQIMLQLPMKIICSPLCKGLCPYCGVNRNEEQCECHTSSIDERFSILKQFQVKPKK